MYLDQLQRIVDRSTPNFFNNILQIFIIADSIIYNIEHSFTKLDHINFMENVLFDEITQETSKQFYIDFISILVQVFN